LISVQSLTNTPIASVKTLFFQYDYLSRRVRKTTYQHGSPDPTDDRCFLYSGFNLIGEIDARNTSVICGYVWGLDLSGSLQGANGVGGLIAVNDVSGV